MAESPQTVREYQGALFSTLESPQQTIFDCIVAFMHNADNVGICFAICNRLAKYPLSDIEFFLPQLVHLFVTVETESAALEDLLQNLASMSTHCTLVIFWHLQASLADLADQPQHPGFLTAKRLYNRLQYETFDFGPPPSTKIREHTSPALVLASSIAGALVPEVTSMVKPLVICQGRRPRSNLLRIAHKIIRRPQNHAPESAPPDSDRQHIIQSRTEPRKSKHSSSDREASPKEQSEPVAERRIKRIASSSEAPQRDDSELDDADEDTENFGMHKKLAASLPDLSREESVESSAYFEAARRMSGDMVGHSALKALKLNYFRSETQFVYSLQSIANKLVSVPVKARLSALQLELALLNQDLPAEVDIPTLIASSSSSKLNRIVRISPSEATVLNSAEKVPYLLLVEYLKDDITFNINTDRNRHILARKDKSKYLFERSFVSPHRDSDPGPAIDSLIPVEEKDMGDFSIAEMEKIELEEKILESTNQAPKESTSASKTYERRVNEDFLDIATQMRTAGVILAQLDGAEGSKLPKHDVEALKANIIASMQEMQDHQVLTRGGAGDRKLENDLKTAGLSTSDDPSAANLSEDWLSRRERIRRSSPYGGYPNWDVFSVIVKTGDDLRQESLACQLIQMAQNVWKESHIDVWVKSMSILITSSNSGLVETITNGLSIHSIKKAMTAAAQSLKPDDGQAPPQTDDGQVATLLLHFTHRFGTPGSKGFKRAVDNFVKSLAGYSLLCYILQIKDRHNGNILLDNDGHIIHIDFGFMLSNSPGHFAFEAAPFKLTYEYVELMGGLNSEAYARFLSLMKAAFKALRLHASVFIDMVQVMSRNSKLPCFQNGPATATQLRQRMQLDLKDEDVDAFVEQNLVNKSYGSYKTRIYDQFQMVTQGIFI